MHLPQATYVHAIFPRFDLSKLLIVNDIIRYWNCSRIYYRSGNNYININRMMNVFRAYLKENCYSKFPKDHNFDFTCYNAV